VKYSELVVWQKAMSLVEDIYAVTRTFPVEEKYALASQLQRAAVSIPANIAEGHGRKYTNAFVNHLSIASGSLMELETLVQLGKRLGYLNTARQDDLLLRTDEISRMLSGLKTSLQS
jgi:four helix bundle protein